MRKESFVRRDVLKGAIAMVGSSCFSGRSGALPNTDATRIGTIHQGALSGGGYFTGIGFSKDMATFIVLYDGCGAFIWNSERSQWDNILSQDRMSGPWARWGNPADFGGGCAALSVQSLAVAPSDGRVVYAVVAAYQGTPAYLWKSIDGCKSWSDTGQTIPIWSSHGTFPSMAVDPANPNVVLVSDDAGAIHYTSDGFATKSILNAPGGPLAGVLPSALVVSAPTAGSNSLSVDAIPNNVFSNPAYPVHASNVSRNNGIVCSNPASSKIPKTLTLGYKLTAGFAGVRNGDTIVLGGRAVVVFDPSSAVADGKTQGIYVGWSSGAKSLHRSIDGGKVFEGMAGGGPDTIIRACISTDGVLYCIDNAKPATVRNAWRCRRGEWTNLPVSAPSTSNTWGACTADPINKGHVVLAAWAGNFQMSADYGDHWYPRPGGINPRVASDVPWLGPNGTLENWQSVGTIAFDPVTSGKLWFTEGIGVWYCNPTSSRFSTPAITIYSQNKNQQSLICNEIVKPPGGALVVAAQDRVGLRLASVTQEPIADFGIQTALGGGVQHGWSIDYSKDHPAVMAICVGTYLWVSADGGVTWKRRLSQPAGVTNGAGAIAVQKSFNSIDRMNLVWFPVNGLPAHTMDGGQTWANCDFKGGITGGFSWSSYLNRHIVVADLADADTYYAFSYNLDKSGGLWRSTDRGANWSNMSGGIANLRGSASVDFNLKSVPGKHGHLLLAYGTAANDGKRLMRSVNGGSGWREVMSTGPVWQVAAGKAAPGAGYPSIYIAGLISKDPDPGIFRSDDFTDDPSVMPTWRRLCRAPAGNMDSPKSMCADLETYGTFYVSFGGTGYAYGKID